MGRGKLGRDGVNGLLRVGRGRKAVIFNGFGHFRLRGRSVKEGLPDAGSIIVAVAEGVRVDAEGRACILMPHAAGDGYRVDAVGKQRAGVRVPLRYNYDKPEKPCISRVIGLWQGFSSFSKPKNRAAK